MKESTAFITNLNPTQNVQTFWLPYRFKTGNLIYENTGLKICDNDLPFMCPNAEKTGDCLIYSTLDNCAKFEQCENDVIDYRYTVCAETEPVEERAVFCNHKKNIDFFEAFDFFNLEKYQLFDDYTKWALSEQYPRRGSNAR